MLIQNPKPSESKAFWNEVFDPWMQHLIFNPVSASIFNPVSEKGGILGDLPLLVPQEIFLSVNECKKASPVILAIHRGTILMWKITKKKEKKNCWGVREDLCPLCVYCDYEQSKHLRPDFFLHNSFII